MQPGQEMNQLPPAYNAQPEKTMMYSQPTNAYPQPTNAYPPPNQVQPQQHGYGQPGPAQPMPSGYQQPAQPAWQPQPQQQQQQQVVNNTTVVSQPAAPVVVVQNNIRGSDCLCCSIFNLLCCNPIFGLIAVIFSCMAKDAYDRGDTDSGRSHYNVAKAMNILGPLITWSAAIGLIIYFVVIVGSVFG